MKLLRKYFDKILLVVLVIFLCYVFYLKSVGIPNGVDSGAHLFRTIFLYNNLSEGILPLWNNLWYAGSPFLLLYGPLAFYVAIPFAFLAGPIAAYKIVEILFFLLSVVSVYFFAKRISKNRKVGFLAAFFFAISPFIIFNFSVVDRFATIVELFFFINSLYLLFSLYSNPNRKTAIFLGLFSALTLLSQGFGFFVLLIIFLAAFLMKQSFTFLKNIFVSIGVALLVSSIWMLFAFPNFVFNLSNNFANIWSTRKFLDLTRIGGTLFMLGLPALTLVALQFDFFRKNRQILMLLILIFTFLASIFYQVKYNLTLYVLLFSSAISIFLIFLKNFQFILNEEMKFLFILSILFIFLSSFLPLYSFTFLQAIDPYRVAVFTTIPLVIFSAYALQKSKIGILLFSLALLSVSVSLLTTVWPYGINIDSNLVEKLKAVPEGRMIAPEPPTWTHMLPALTGKGSIDGLSPYERYLPELRKLRNQHFGLWFDDVTKEQRKQIYDYFINNSEKFAIKYVIITKSEWYRMPNVSSTLLYSNDEFDVYQLNNQVSFVEGGSFERPNPNTFIITPVSSKVTVKEAYAPGWRSSCGTLEADGDGFMEVTGNCTKIVLEYKPWTYLLDILR